MWYTYMSFFSRCYPTAGQRPLLDFSKWYVKEKNNEISMPILFYVKI